MKINVGQIIQITRNEMEYALVAWVVVSSTFCGMFAKDWRTIATFKTVAKEQALEKCEQAAKDLDLTKFKCVKL